MAANRYRPRLEEHVKRLRTLRECSRAGSALTEMLEVLLGSKRSAEAISIRRANRVANARNVHLAGSGAWSLLLGWLAVVSPTEVVRCSRESGSAESNDGVVRILMARELLQWTALSSPVGWR